MTRRRSLIFAAALVAGAACTGQDNEPTAPTSSETPTSAAASVDAELARTLCGALREQTNVLVHIANDAVAGIGGKSPQERTAAILGGFDAAESAAASFAGTVETLPLPDVPERDSVRDQVVVGATAAIDELAQERARFLETGPTAEDDAVQGRVGEFFNSVEKVMSVVEPVISTYDRLALKAAFLDEPSCRHVIQQFRLDD